MSLREGEQVQTAVCSGKGSGVYIRQVSGRQAVAGSSDIQPQNRTGRKMAGMAGIIMSVFSSPATSFSFGHSFPSFFTTAKNVYIVRQRVG